MKLSDDEVMRAINIWRGYNGTLSSATAFLNELLASRPAEGAEGLRALSESFNCDLSADWDDNGQWYIEPLGITGRSLSGDSEPDCLAGSRARFIVGCVNYVRLALSASQREQAK